MRKWIIALSITLFAIGGFFLYFGLRAYLFPQVRGQLHGGAAWAGFGLIVALVGVLLLLLDVASVSRSSNGEGIQSATWNCSETSLEPTDAIKIKVYIRIGPYPEAGAVTFITEQLGATKLEQSTWTVYYYTKYVTNRYSTIGYFYWGTSTYNSHIENIKYT